MRVSNGTDTLVAGIVAAVLLPVLALGVKMGLFPAALVSIAVFFALRALLGRTAPSAQAIEGPDPTPMAEAQEDNARALIEEGRAALARLRAAGRNLADKDLNADARRLYHTSDRLLKDIEADPARAMSVRRFITFYLPNAASVAEGWRQLEGRALPAPERLAQTRETFDALNEAAERYANALVQPQVQTLDLDLKVLKDALKHDLETLP